jgi:hypothetical protein
MQIKLFTLHFLLPALLIIAFHAESKARWKERGELEREALRGRLSKI